MSWCAAVNSSSSHCYRAIGAALCSLSSCGSTQLYSVVNPLTYLQPHHPAVSLQRHGQEQHSEALCGQPGIGHHAGGAVGHLRTLRPGGQLQRAAAVRFCSPARGGCCRACHSRAQWAGISWTESGGGGVQRQAAALHQGVCGQPEWDVHHGGPTAAVPDVWKGS